MKKEVKKFVEFHFSEEEINAIKETFEILENLYNSIEDEGMYEEMIAEAYGGLMEVTNILNFANCITVEG